MENIGALQESLTVGNTSQFLFLNCIMVAFVNFLINERWWWWWWVINKR